MYVIKLNYVWSCTDRVPVESFNVHKDSHQLWDGHGGMCVIQLDGDLENIFYSTICQCLYILGSNQSHRVRQTCEPQKTYFVWEALKRGATRTALLGGLESTDDVLECGCDDKVLLLQTKFFSFEELQTDTWRTEMMYEKKK